MTEPSPHACDASDCSLPRLADRGSVASRSEDFDHLNQPYKTIPVKKPFLAIAVLGAFAGGASAQSSVTLFGIADLGARAVKNGDGSTVKSLTPNGLSSSRLGFRGEEDLGGGLKAGFWLEADVSADTGAANANKFFNRRSTVSLVGPFGEVRAGRDYTPNFGVQATFDAWGSTGGAVGSVLNLIVGSAGSVGALGSGAGTLVRADNSVSYFLPAKIGGVYGQVMAAAGEGTTTTNGNNRYVGGRIGYAAGPFDVAGAYGRTRNPGQGDLRIWDVGASFRLPVVRLMALYHRGDYEPTGLASRSQKLWGIGANVPIGQGEIRATYQRSDIGGGGPTFIGLRDEDDARQYAVGYVYNLSKRTALYADLGRLQNRGRSTLSIAGGTTSTGDFSQGGRNSTALALGVRHSF